MWTWFLDPQDPRDALEIAMARARHELPVTVCSTCDAIVPDGHSRAMLGPEIALCAACCATDDDPGIRKWAARAVKADEAYDEAVSKMATLAGIGKSSPQARPAARSISSTRAR